MHLMRIASLFWRLHAAVTSLRGRMTQIFCGVGGSQEITTYRISLPDGSLVAEAETYIGLCIRGPAESASVSFQA